MGSPRRADSGFALVELGIALCVLVLAITGVCTLLPVAQRAVSAGRDQTMATWLATQRLEDLRALQWSVDDAGVPVSDMTTDLSVAPFSGGGTGLLPSPTDALDVNRPGFVDYLDQNGQWVGTGAVPPGAAVYIRRWQITADTDAPADLRLLQVLVTTVRREAGLSSGTARLPHLVDALVVTLRTRVVS